MAPSGRLGESYRAGGQLLTRKRFGDGAGIDEVAIDLRGRQLICTTRLTEEERRTWEALQMPSLQAFRVA